MRLLCSRPSWAEIDLGQGPQIVPVLVKGRVDEDGKASVVAVRKGGFIVGRPTVKRHAGESITKAVFRTVIDMATR